MKPGFLYLMASRPGGTLYLGVTSDLATRVFQHRNGLVDGFTKRYGCRRLVWYEACNDLQNARARELQMKKWMRRWKVDLIRQRNPDWNDLWDEIAHP